MDKQELFRKKIAERLTKFRKQNHLTQNALANKLNYSDKAISKWERGEALPDLYVLNQIADIYGVNVDDFINDKPNNTFSPKLEKKISSRLKFFIALASCVLVWFLATFVYAIMFSILKSPEGLWLIFIWAIPATGIVGLVFNWIWGKIINNFWFVSLISWGVIIGLYLSINIFELWIFFVACGVFQLLICLYFWTLKIKFTKEKLLKNKDL